MSPFRFEYTPESAAEIVARLRKGDGNGRRSSTDAMRDASIVIGLLSAERDQLLGPESDDRDELVTARIIHALQAARSERDRLHKAITDALAAAPQLGDSHWRSVDRIIGILRSALESRGVSDE